MSANVVIKRGRNFSQSDEITSFEDILDLIGTNGFRNYSIFVTAAICTMISPLYLFTYQFLGDTPPHYRCHIPQLDNEHWTNQQIYNIAIPFTWENGEIVYSGCTTYDLDFDLMGNFTFEEIQQNFTDDYRESLDKISCNRRVFEGNFDTVVTEWDLVCERRAIYSTIQAGIQGGLLLGSLMFGYLTDVYGRALTFKFAAIFYLMINLMIPLSISVLMFIVMKSVSAFVAIGFYMSAFILVMEIASTGQRTLVGNYFVVPFSFGIMIAVGISWAVRPWKYLQFYLTLPAFILLPAFGILPESPRWLILKGRYEEALAIIKGIATWNGRTLPSDSTLLSGMMYIKQSNAEKCDEENESSNTMKKCVAQFKFLSTLLCDTSLRRKTPIIFFLWFSTALIYYGLSLKQTALSTDPYLYILIGGFLELVGYLMLWPLVSFLGRKKTLTFLFFVSALSIFIAMVMLFTSQTQNYQWVKESFLLLGKFAITPIFHLLWLFTAELYPTNLRSLAVGESSSVGRIGSICSPYINDILGAAVFWAPAAVFGVLSLGAGVATLALQETSGAMMPDSVGSSNHLTNRRESVQSKISFSTDNKDDKSVKGDKTN